MMENDIRGFLKRIVWSLALGLFWLFIALSIGLYTGLLVPEHGVHTHQIIFYIFLAVTFAWVAFTIYRMWKGKTPPKD